MNKLIGSLCICVGVYFIDYYASIIMGYSRFAALMQSLIFIIPFAAALILTVVGFLSIPENEKADLGSILSKVMLTVFVAAIPIGIHFAILKLAYSTNPTLQSIIIKSLFLLIGCALLACGFFLLLRKRNPIS